MSDKPQPIVLETSSNPTSLRLTAPLEEYLTSSPLIDIEHPKIQAYVAAHPRGHRTDEEVVEEVFGFMRDQVSHSMDVKDPLVTAKASEVMDKRVGMCYANSHLFAALLRAYGIPCGICYQRLALGATPDKGYGLHALNAVYLASRQRWIRLDARGNKPGVDAQFSIDTERLAFNVRPDIGEKDYLVNYATPPSVIVETLASNTDCLVMCSRHLPTRLDED